MIRLPELLDSTLSPVRRLQPVKESIRLNLTPLSAADMDLLPGDTIPDRAFVRLYTIQGMAGIFRASCPQQTYGDRSTRIRLEHAVCEIGDWTVKTEIKEQEKTAAQAITAIFANYGGTLWTLGTISCTDTVILQASKGANVLEAILNVMSQVPGYMVTLDQSSSPWVLGVSARPSTVAAEGRLSRNISSVTISRDDSELCNRVYADNMAGHLDDLTSQTKYGIIEHTIGETGLSSSIAQRMAQAYLNAHKEPALSVEISMLDLSTVTGETLDSITLGKMYRLAIPQDELVIEQTVVSISCPDVYGQPNSISVSLANEVRDTVTYLRRQRRGGGVSARNTDRKVDEMSVQYTQKFEVSDQKVASIMTATGVLLDENYEPVIDPVTGLFVFDTTSSGATLQSRINQNASAISLEATTRAADKTELTGLISTEAGKISQIVTAVGANGQVTAASIVTAINARTGTGVVKIKADQIELEGTTIINLLEGGAVDVYSLTASEVIAGDLVFDDGGGSIETGFNTTTLGNKTNPQQIKFLGDSSFTQASSVTYEDFPHYHTVTFSNGQFTIGGVTDTAPSPFDIAATQWYADQVLAAKQSVTINSATWVWDANEGDLVYNAATSYGQSLEVTPPNVVIEFSGGYAIAKLKSSQGVGYEYARSAYPSVSPTLHIGSTWDYDDGNYTLTVQIKDGATVLETDYVELPSTKVIVGTPTATWSSANHNYTLSASAGDYLTADTSSQYVLATGSGSGTLTPTDAIDYGKTLVTVGSTFETTSTVPSGVTPSMLTSGAKYKLSVTKDGTAVSAEDKYYEVPSGSTVNVQPVRYGTYTSNGTYTLSPSSSYDAMEKASITVDVPAASHNITCSSTVTSIGTNRGSRTNAGSISKSGLVANSYLGFTISCGGTSKSFYISVNA